MVNIMSRRQIGDKSSRKLFTKTAMKINKKNVRPRLQRGGGRL